MRFSLTPYNHDFSFCWFDTIEQYEALKADLNANGCEEWELDIVESDITFKDLYSDLSSYVTESNLELLIERVDCLDEREQVALAFLLQNTLLNLEGALDKIDEVCIHEGTLADYAQEMTEGCNEVPDYLQYYIDYEKMGRDMKINGDVVEMSRNYIVTNSMDF